MGGSASSARGAGSPTEKLTLLEGGGERGGGWKERRRGAREGPGGVGPGDRKGKGRGQKLGAHPEVGGGWGSSGVV